MKISYLEEYNNVIDTGSFSEAARKAHITQSALSKHIKALEEDVGVQLLKRDASGAAPTDAGKSFYQDSLALVKNYSCAVDKARSIANQTKLTVRIGYFYEAGKKLLDPLLKWYARHHPNTLLSLHAMDIDALAEGLLERKFDLIIMPNVNPAISVTCDSLPLCTCSVVFATNWSNRLAQRKSVTFEQISRTSLNFPDPKRWPSLYDYLEKKLGNAPRYRALSNVVESSTLFDLIEEGKFSAVVADYNVEVHTRGISYVPIADDNLFTMNVSAFWMLGYDESSAAWSIIANFKKAAEALRSSLPQ